MSIFFSAPVNVESVAADGADYLMPARVRRQLDLDDLAASFLLGSGAKHFQSLSVSSAPPLT